MYRNIFNFKRFKYESFEDEAYLQQQVGPIYQNKERLAAIEEAARNKIKQSKIFYSKYKPKDINKFKDKKIFAFTGIGNPSNFFELLKKNNLQVLDHKSFPDHYNYSIEDLEKLKFMANELNAILVTTEKDYFRINENLRKNIEKFDIDLEIENKDEFIKLIKKII